MSGRDQSPPDVLSFGCRLNALEAAAMRKAAQNAGHGDLLIVNTCAVTNEAVRQARQSIRRAARDNPQRRIVVTGCAAQIDPESFAAMPEVAGVIGNADKAKPATWTALEFGGIELPRARVNDIMALEETAHYFVAGAGLDGMEGRSRAFVEVQNGCDHRCTFCIIPYGRGPSRSAPAGDVVQQIQRLVDNGYNEVVLTGVDMTSWGHDLPGKPSFGRLVQQILKHVPDLPRLRISSIDCIEADEALLEAIESDRRLMPHLHLSLQAGDDMILKRMKRRHLRADAIRFCDDIRKRRPDVVFGADIIAGFPTETEAMFEQSLALVDECGLTFLHVFPFSPRPGTPAARMPMLPKDIVKERARRLRDKGDAAHAAHLQTQHGKTLTLLTENKGLARAEDFTLVRTGQHEPGMLVQALVTGNDGSALIASVEAA
ncbi:MAG: tRNA (N(6)-L-threonylcarbamoyladenosine(37)-C(2))-methylthiotransferase MtaB [Beijerinckiaceae bacterium]